MPRAGTAKGRPAALWIVLAVMLAGLTALAGLSMATPGTGPSQDLASGRNPYLWPFASNSIWNLPIGANAVYVAAHIKVATRAGMTTDPDVIILTPTAPSTAVYQNNDGWSGGSRCSPQGPLLFNGPIPADFIVPGATSSSTPNYATAILMPDNHTLAQGQPMARCTAGDPATMMWFNEKEDLYGTGFSGGHGGSMLSSIGGTIRLGELVPGGVIRHALKVNLYGHDDYFYNASTKGYRWPATTSDSYASSVYGGTVAALRMGSLLALPPNLNLSSMGLETQPARILAQAFQNYGAYTVDDTGWSVYAIETEFSPKGHVEDEFQQAWGFSMTPSSKTTPWSRDMDRIFGNLSVVDNWGATKWTSVAASNGTQGAGGGAPRVPWAPPFSAPSGQVTVQAPAAGVHVNPGQSVTVSWTSSGSLVANSASVSFSSDGGLDWAQPFATGRPLNGSLTWQVPNVTTNQAMLRVVAKDTSGNDVEGRSGLFIIESPTPPAAPPQVTVQSPAAGVHLNPGQNVTISWTSSGSLQPSSAALSFSSNGGSTWGAPFATGQPLNGSFTWQVPNVLTNDAILRVVAKAANGSNVEGRSGVFVIETPTSPGAPPQITVQSPAAGVHVNPGQSLTISWTSSGSLQSNSASVSFSSDGGATWAAPFATGRPVNGSINWQVPNVLTNQADLRVVAKAVNGSNVEGLSGLFVIESATIPGNPVARMTFAPTWPMMNASVSFDASASSPSTPNGTLQVRWDWQQDGLWDTSWSSTLTATHTYKAQGADTVRLEVRDATGSTDNATASFVVDGTPPVTTATVSGTMGKKGWYTSVVTISLSATDAVSGVASTYFRVDGGSWQTYSGPFSLGSGRHKVNFYSVDRAGVVESAQLLKVNVNLSSPKFLSVSPTGVVFAPQVSVSWNATNDVAAPIDYATSVDGAPFIEAGANTSLSMVLPDGEHSVLVRATDESGNSATALIAFRVDTNPFSFTGPYSGIPTILAFAAITVTALAVSHRHRAKARRRARSHGAKRR